MLLWIDGFDIYGTSSTGVTNMLEGVYAEITANSSPTTTQARTGVNSYGLSLNGTFRRIFGSNLATVGVGMAWFFNSLPTASNAIMLAQFLDNGGSAVCTITMSTTGQIEVRTGGVSGTVRASSSPVLVTTAWQHVEIKTTFHATTGACEIRVNGQTILNASNINTDALGTSYSSQVRVGSGGTAGFPTGNPSVFVDDIFAWDLSGTYNNDFIGDKKVYALVPTSDTAVADWLPDTGSTGYTQIDEIPPVSTDYIQANTVGDESEFGMSNLPSDVTNVLGIQFYTKMLKTDAGDSSVQVSVVSGASDASGADRPITTNATVYTDVFEEDPDTSAPWTLSGVDAMLARVARTL